MPDKKITFKWQNLLTNFCPKCEYALFEKKVSRGTYHNCSNRDCDFGISEDHFIRLLGDPTHPIQRYVSPELKKELLAVLTLKK